MTKICSKCKIEKENDEFSKNKNTKDGLNAWCKPCNSDYKKIYYMNNKEELLSNKKDYYDENKEIIITKKRIYYEDNKSIIRQSQNSYNKNRSKNDPTFKIRRNCSRMINNLLRGDKNNSSILDHLAYTISELIVHLEKQFEPWMNWGNYGVYIKNNWDDSNQATWKWHIDHKIPQSSLLYSSMEDENFKKCWDLENLRPLSAKENLKKGKKE